MNENNNKAARVSTNKKSNNKNNLSDTEVDYDQLISSAGEFGLYQIFLFLSTCPFYFFGVFSYFTQLFLTEASPNHWCWVPELQNATELERRNLAIPSDVNAPFGYSRCQVYKANWTEVLLTGTKPDHTWETEACQNGWEFNKTEFPYPTITSELGWVCNKDSYQATAQSIFFVGSILGGFVIGWIADRYGRIPAAVSANLIGCVAGIASTFTQNFVQFTLCRFVMGMSYDNCMMMTYLLVIEYVAPKYRSVMANLSFAIFFTAAQVVLPWIALVCGHWKTLSLATSIPMALSILTPFIIPESPLWLLSKGRVDDAVNKVLNIARVHKREISEEMIENFKMTVSNKKESKGSVTEIFKRPLLLRTFICICFEFMFCMIIFDSLVRTIGLLQFDFFISFSVVSLTELPSLVILSFGLDYIGRKRMVLLSLGVCAICSYLIPFVGEGLPAVICAVIARFCVNMSCNTCMQWAAELLPTPVRGSGSSVVHIFGYIGTVLSPFVAYLDVYRTWLPMVVVGTVCVLGTIVGLMLPETAKRDIPQTFEDAEELVRSQGFFDFLFRKKENIETNNEGQINHVFDMN